jgi:hypothetical protein
VEEVNSMSGASTWFRRALTSWFASSLAVVVSLAVWVAAMEVSAARLEHLAHNIVDVSLAFGAMFAVTAAVLYVPVFSLLGAGLGPRLRRPLAAAIGLALAPAAYLAVAMQFREGEDPQTIAAWLTYWAANLPEVGIGILPFAVGGALFGLMWTGWRHAPVVRRVEPVTKIV